jgi:hypothetical protein
MRTTVLAILLVLTACGGANSVAESPDSLRERAKPAERNLVLIRDAVVKYHEANGAVPQSVSDLEAFGGGPEDFEKSDDYADIGYTFVADGLKFENGKLTRGWFLASPRGNREALQVRMNGVTGEFEYLPSGEQWKPAG